MKKIPKIIIIFLILLCTVIPKCLALSNGEVFNFTNYFNRSAKITIPIYWDDYDYHYIYEVIPSVYYETKGSYYYVISSSSSISRLSSGLYSPIDSSRFYYDMYYYEVENSKLTLMSSESPGSALPSFHDGYHVILHYSNSDISDATSGGVLYPGTDITFINPSFITLEEDLKTGNFNNIEIAPNDYPDPFYLHVAEISRPVAEDTSIIYYTNQKTFYLGADVSYYVPTGNLYSVPKSELGFAIETGKEYIFAISSNSSSLPNISEEEIFQKVEVIAEERSENAILNDKMDIQNETSKGMWDTLKDILSYINPFSENFFVYKLIEMLIEALKSLFIPQDGFLGTYFEELKNWFSDRLGFLFYPFELLIDILNQILGINFSEPVFNIPDINEPFTNKKLISATTFNFNSLLENNVLKTIHDIYLICLDAFIVFELVNLFRRKYEEVTTK